MKKISFKVLALFLACASSMGLVISPATASSISSAKGSSGQTLIASITGATLPAGETTQVRVRGRGYNVKNGIYVTFCVVPEKGQKPEHCGSYNPFGINTQAHWISSNPPFYARPLATKFGRGGTFRVTLPISSTIGDYDCTQVRCGILTRADHTNPTHRNADVIIPITFN